ncbi:phosphoglycerate mutase family protein [Vagococcus fluvialis]|uniref:phosphoglycerate mutase family protein n=1 Tax=Vagococcus fluvialis TaxID=2738 RepID=UPI00203462F2|nr:histidine phosphatase family protein [Vagococcus fluvialis]
MKTTIYFIRHGQTQWNKEQCMQGWQNSNLTDLGKEQADLLGKKFKKKIYN